MGYNYLDFILFLFLLSTDCKITGIHILAEKVRAVVIVCYDGFMLMALVVMKVCWWKMWLSRWPSLIVCLCLLLQK